MTASGGRRVFSALARPVRPLYDRALGRSRVLPDFLILGAQKAGTTSLYEYLCQHPQVLPALGKEVHYFDRNAARGPWWYRRHFPTRAELADAAARRGRAATGEATPDYLYYPDIPARIAALVPDAALIVLLRDPVARAYSHYRQVVRQGREPLSFADALAAEEGRLAAADEKARAWAHRNHSYRARGLYAEQLRRYLDLFPADRMLVLNSEEMFAAPQANYDQAVAFLGLEPWRLRDDAGWNRGPERVAEIPCAKELRAFYAPHNRRLAELLGRDFDWPGGAAA